MIIYKKRKKEKKEKKKGKRKERKKKEKKGKEKKKQKEKEKKKKWHNGGEAKRGLWPTSFLLPKEKTNIFLLCPTVN